MTTMRNFDTELDEQGVTRLVTTTTSEVVIEETVKVTSQPSMVSKAYLAKDEWDWNDLRDYVVGQIEERFGAFPRDSRKESGIFKSFLGRYGADRAQAIARFAFEIGDGRWKGAPISVNRFCKGSDPYFGDVILARLADAPIEGW